MRIIVLDKSSSGSRELELSSLVLWTLPVLLLFCVLSAVYAGYRLAIAHSAPLPADLLAAWKVELSQLDERVRALDAEADRDSRAYAARVAALQARVMRMEAIGERLAAAANLKDGEFDFRQEPGVGGPAISQPTMGGDIERDLDQSITKLDSLIADRERQLDFLDDLLSQRRFIDEVTLAGKPVLSGYISSGFGARADPFDGHRAMHEGVDFSAPIGTPVVAIASGVVVTASRVPQYGNLVELKHSDGYHTRYAHNSELLVHEGDIVKKGQVIAKVGNTGRSTGAHLHLEVLREGIPVDPMAYIMGRSRRS